MGIESSGTVSLTKWKPYARLMAITCAARIGLKLFVWVVYAVALDMEEKGWFCAMGLRYLLEKECVMALLTRLLLLSKWDRPVRMS